jgi:LuxR family maltose regulon positive regulatory protein
MRALETCLLEARAKLDREPGGALALVEQALDLAAPNFPLRLFLDEAQEIRDVLLSIDSNRIRTWPAERRAFYRAVVRAMRGESGGGDRSGPEAPHLTEPMSDREKEILQLIAAGSTNTLIASTLAISENTVKWHVKNIFSKLAVGNRTSAVAVARQMQLLQSDARRAATTPATRRQTDGTGRIPRISVYEGNKADRRDPFLHKATRR